MGQWELAAHFKEAASCMSWDEEESSMVMGV